jgi:NAD(P)-dependent dehydrogenase (short-subunit alcohol dehydrogenase family)
MKLGPPTLPFPVQFVKALTLSPPSPPKGLSLAGQVGIITGGDRGLGFESADILLTYKLSHLIITVRNEESGREAVAKLKKSYPEATIEAWSLDMALYDSIQAFVTRCATLPRIDFVILNAGLMNSDFILNKTTEHEMQVQVNYLSTVLLTFLLLPVLKKSRHVVGKPSGITIAGSGLAFVAKFPESTASNIMAEFDKQPAKPWNLSVSMDR